MRTVTTATTTSTSTSSSLHTHPVCLIPTAPYPFPTPGGAERPSRDALFRTILSISTVHVTSHFDQEVMEAVRISVRSERPFDEFKVIYLHCIDLDTKTFTPVTSFPCLEICCMLGHFSFPGELAVRRLCCFLWSEESKAKLPAYQSPVLLHVKSVLLFHGNYFPLHLFVSAYSRLFFILCQYVECAYDREIRDRLHCIYQQKAFIIS